MSEERVPRLFTPEEYLLIEFDAPTRSEYDNSKIYAMAGASEIHGDVIENLIGFLFPQLRPTKCRATTHDVKVRPEMATAYYYPDVVVTCGERIYEDSKQRVLLNPVSIFEVLSPSTASYDQVVKYNRYLEIESLKDYVLVAQDVAHVVHHSKDEGSEWNTRTHTKLTETFTLRGAPASLSLSDIYDRVTLAELE